MSELIKARCNDTNIRWRLLATASAIALMGAAFTAGHAKASDDADRPTVWIELGGQLSRLDEGQQTFAPIFPDSPARPSIFSPSQPFERLPSYGFDETGKLSFQPKSSDWVFSASVLYGRASSNRHEHQQTNPKTWFVYYNYYGRVTKVESPPLAGRFADTTVHNGETHLVLDFQAGKDVGLGIFGGDSGSSVLNLGVRFAQFTSRSNIALKSDPDFHFVYKYNPALLNFGFTSSKRAIGQVYHSNTASLLSERSFHGIGPSLSWNGSATLVGNSQSGSVSFDGGLNVSVLFGRQRARVHHQVTGQFHGTSYTPGLRVVAYHPVPIDINRDHTIAVPNIGGFAGATWRIENFKMSAGYRADFFIGAMDNGIDAHKSQNVGFYGPFATVSIGLGG